MIIATFSFVYCILALDSFNIPINLTQSTYLSIVTITTLGFGDITPTAKTSMLLVSLEALLGVAIAGLLINSIWQRFIDQIDKQQNEKIKITIKHSNKNKLLSYYYYVETVLNDFNSAIHTVTTPIAKRNDSSDVNKEFKFSDLQDMFKPCLNLKHDLQKNAIELYTEKEEQLIEEFKRIIINFDLSDCIPIQDSIRTFLTISNAGNFNSILNGYASNPQIKVQLEKMIAGFKDIPPPEYHQSNLISPVIAFYQALKFKCLLIENILTEFNLLKST